MKIFLMIMLPFLCMESHAITIKMGVLAPEGTAWAQNLKRMEKEIKKATKKKVKFKIYYGGSQGDESDVLRKIRVGQLHGGIFTGKTLGEISGDVRVIEVPFNFDGNGKKAWRTVEKMTGFFNKKLKQKEFVSLGLFELGFVYIVSRKKVVDLDGLKGIKLWAWEGDKLAASMIKSMGLVSVPLALPDVLSSLSTGIIDAAYAPPMGIVALQWNSKVGYLIDFPIAYSIGAFLIHEKYWNKIPKDLQKTIIKIARSHIAKVNTANMKDNKESLAALKSMGVEFINFSKKDKDKAKSYRQKVIAKLTGNLFSKDALNRLNKANK